MQEAAPSTMALCPACPAQRGLSPSQASSATSPTVSPSVGVAFVTPPCLWRAHFACSVTPAAMETSTPTRWAGLEPLSGGQRFLQQSWHGGQLPPARQHHGPGVLCGVVHADQPGPGLSPPSPPFAHTLEGWDSAASSDTYAAQGPGPPQRLCTGQELGQLQLRVATTAQLGMAGTAQDPGAGHRQSSEAPEGPRCPAAAG